MQALHEIELTKPLDYRPEKPKPAATKEKASKTKAKTKDVPPTDEAPATTDEPPAGKKDDRPVEDPFGAGAGAGGGEADPFK